ncbi:hypothetical protein HPP92_022435 [Vanilla planifolia]|uniref:Reverse transcriptase domain-containing protein n=1 Tax=Vanilla planifolia TaxID=51239 RepID=A0A835UF35_VANPL|nr:hypothetical protein HPP92_022435 [Vanilla planifolia]
MNQHKYVLDLIDAIEMLGYKDNKTPIEPNMKLEEAKAPDVDGQHSSLVRDVSMEEISTAIRSCRRNKASGVDGITSEFIVGYWDIMQEDIIQAVYCFFRDRRMPCSWKDTLVILIPKRQGACRPEHYRPISLCNLIYKIVARILVDRLKAVLPSIIASEQGAFVPRRTISDNIFIA